MCQPRQINPDSRQFRSQRSSASEYRLPSTNGEEHNSSSPNNVCDSFTNINQFFHFEKELGFGSFGVVHKCVDRFTGESVACKSIPKSKIRSQMDMEDLESEVLIMEAMKEHPGVVKLHGVFEDPKNFHLAMEYCSGGDLFERIKSHGPFSEPESAQICQKLASVLLYAHSRGIMHRDIKPENILMASRDSNTDIRLADFGSAACIGPNQKLNQLIGSPLYMAPSVLSHCYGTEADLWSLGVVLYILLSGVPPFWGKTNAEIFRRIQHGSVNLDGGKMANVSPAAKDLISKLLNRNVDEALSALDVLEHPWILYHTRGKGQLKKAKPSRITASSSRKYNLSISKDSVQDSRRRRSEADSKDASTSRRSVFSRDSNMYGIPQNEPTESNDSEFVLGQGSISLAEATLAEDDEDESDIPIAESLDLTSDLENLFAIQQNMIPVVKAVQRLEKMGRRV